eukprot:4937121-Pyramimonas_sp.AAC.1
MGYRTCRMIAGYHRQGYTGIPGARLRVEYLAGSGTQDLSSISGSGTQDLLSIVISSITVNLVPRTYHPYRGLVPRTYHP